MRFVHAHAPAAEFLNDGVVRNAKKAGPLLVGPPRYRRRQAAADFLYGCGR